MRYEHLGPISRVDAQQELTSGDRERISRALVRLALHDDDAAWLQELCLSYAGNADPWIRGVAAQCFGHIARLHRRIDNERVRPVLKRLLEDPATTGKAQDALDDLQVYAPD